MRNREIYMKKLLSFKDKKLIKVITGMRRCGKSTLLDLFEQRLLNDGVKKENIIKMNFESMEFDEITDYKQLYKYLREKIIPDEKNYLILDEIQQVTKWQKAINSLFAEFDSDIYISGSNAYLLSSELSTLLSGRYVEINMLPLSFKEYLDFNEFDDAISMEDKFELYLKYGGLPSLTELNKDEETVNTLLTGIYSTVILKDVIQRNSVKDIVLLEKIVMFLADNIGNITSPNNIGTVFAAEGYIDEGKRKRNPASRTIDNYIYMLQNAFVFYGVKRYDVKGKQILKTLGKYYIVDTGLRNTLLGYRDYDYGHILENVVYFELLRRGYHVSIGKIGDKEVDFIAARQDIKKYYQVTASMMEGIVRERELEPLKQIDDNYEKIVLSMDKTFIRDHNGIRIQNIIEFLLEY